MEIPRALEGKIEEIRSRIRSLKRQYGSLANYGRPYLESVEEVAVIYYLYKELGYGLNAVADILEVDKTSVYGLIKRIEEKNSVSITDPSTKKVKTISITPNELLDKARELMGVTAKQKIVDPLQSSLIQSFLRENIERQSNLDRRTFYTEEEKMEAVKVVKALMEKALENNMVSNPDFWDKETLLRLIDLTYSDPKKKRNAVKLLRRIPKFRDWLKGRVGAEKKYVNPKMSVLYYEDYLKLKRLYESGELSEPEFLVLWLHLVTGAREGWGSESIESERIDLDQADTSLIGLKWEKLSKIGDSWILRIYEHKTLKEWTCDLSWLDPDVVPALLRYRREKGSIVKLTGLKTVREFKLWYKKVCRKVSELLGLPFKLTPHDMRRSHISILAQLGIPMEVAVSGLMDFGVGWEDLSTALIFYTRFSRSTKERLIAQIRERQKEYQA